MSSIHLLHVCCAKSLQSCLTPATLWTVAHYAPPSMGFSSQEYWSGLPFLSPGDLSEHQGLFKRVSSSHEVAKVLELQLQHQSFQ